MNDRCRSRRHARIATCEGRAIRWSHVGLVALGMVAFTSGRGLVAQEKPTPAVDPGETAEVIRQDSASRQRPLLAVSQALFVNVLVNRYDAWVVNDDWAKVGPSDWSRNLSLGWEWDENKFFTNMFSHPYHGGLYFNSARANGLDFWESVPVVFLGSWTWEYFAETFRPSLNDFFMTSFGGIALGEVFHRLGTSIRDNRDTGTSRTMREVAALPFDPIGGLNRLVRGEWKRTGSNPRDHVPGAFVFRVHAGARAVADSGYIDEAADVSASSALLLDVSYGDPLLTPHAQPFDVFSVRALVSPGGGGLNELTASGRLFGRRLGLNSGLHRYSFAINQRFDFLNNPAYKYGAQSIEAGFYVRWSTGRTSAVRASLFADAIMLAGVGAPYAGFGERVYDFGPGTGFRFRLDYERGGLSYISLIGRTEYVHSISGASADHNISFGAFEVTLPVTSRFSVGMQSGYFNRASRYSDRPDEKREFPEARFFLAWTRAGLPGFNQ